MKVSREVDLKDFNFWGGAKWFAQLLTDEEFEALEFMFEDLFYCDGEPPTETQINDFVWFEMDYIAEQICGYKDVDELLEDRKKQTEIEL